MAFINKHEPCKKQKTIMENLGFVSGYTNDDDMDKFGKVSWFKDIQQFNIEKSETDLSFRISVYLYPKDVPKIDGIVNEILIDAFKAGENSKIDEIKNTLEKHL